MKIPKKLLSAVISFVVALSSMMGIVAAGDTPTLQFRNEKVTGLTVTKDIYRTSSDTQPLRQTDSTFYSKNELANDEFRLYLLEGAAANSVSPKSGESYTRMNQYGNYYCCPLSDKTLIIRPTASGYEVYYYDSTGKNIYGVGTEHTSTKTDLGERFKEDYNVTGQVTKYFSTGGDGEFYLYDGDLSDQVYFKKLKSTYYYVTEDVSLLNEINNEKIESHKTGVYKTDAETLTTANPALFFDVNDANLFEVRNYFDKPNDAFTIKKTINYFGSSDLLNEEFTFELLINEENPGGYSYVKYDGDSVIEEGSFDYGTATEPAVIKLKGSQHIDIKGIMKNTYIEVREIITDSDGNKLNPHYSPMTVSSIADGKAYTLVTEGKKKYVKWEGNYIKDSDATKSVDKAEYLNVPNVMSVSKTITNPQDLTDYENYEFEFHILKWDGNEYTELAENKQLRYYLRDGLGTPYGDSTKNGAPFITENGDFRIHHGETALFIGLEADEKFQITETGAFYEDNAVTADFKMDKTVYEKTARPETVTDAVTQTSSGEVKDFQNTYNQMLGLSVTKVVEDDYGRSNPDAEYTFKLLKEDTTVTPSVFNEVQFDGKIIVTVNDEVQNWYAYTFDQFEITENETTTKVKLYVEEAKGDAEYQCFYYAGDNKVTFADERIGSKSSSYTLDDNLGDKFVKDFGLTGNAANYSVLPKQSGVLTFTLKKNETANITKLANGTYKVVEVNPNVSTNTLPKPDSSDSNYESALAAYQAAQKIDPNPQNEPHLFVTDVLVNGGDTQTHNKPVNGDANPSLTDVTSEQFVLNMTEARSVTFTNKVRELKYYFDIEKIIFVDKNIHDSDTEQKFVFKVERFAEGLATDKLTADNLLECFYVTINCENKLDYPIDSNKYHYSLYTNQDHNGYPYSDFDDTSGVTIKKTYQKNGVTESYQYPTTIWNGRQTVMVKKKGIYRVSEVTEWSSTDYDFWTGSNDYKGYGAAIAENTTDGYVIFSVTDVKADLFKAEKYTVTDITNPDNPVTTDYYRPTASFTNSETEYAYLNSQSYAENEIKRN